MNLTPAKMRAARAMLGISQAEIARRSETSESTVNSYECGRYKTPRRATLAAWSRAIEEAGVVLTANGVEFGE